jgi:branched-chain amino acid aminotransferase
MSDQTEFILYNGKFLPTGSMMLGADNRCFRYGEGIFETMRFQNNRIALWEMHMNRLYHGMELLQFTNALWGNREKLLHQILHLLKLNLHKDAARVRLQIFCNDGRGTGSGYKTTGYLVQTYPFVPSYIHDETGITAGFHPHIRKSCDLFAQLKSCNFLPYIHASSFAKTNGWDECFVLNQYERFSDASVTNIFWIKNDEIFTPPLSEGPVAGVMRNYLLQTLKAHQLNVQEVPLDKQNLFQADEVFITNAIRGIQSISTIAEKTYVRNMTKKLLQFLPW